MKKIHKWAIWWFYHRPEILWRFWTIISALNLLLAVFLLYAGLHADVNVGTALIFPLLMISLCYFMTKSWGHYIDNHPEREKLEKAIRKKYEKD